jgi:hypothetical protein
MTTIYALLQKWPPAAGNDAGADPLTRRADCATSFASIALSSLSASFARWGADFPIKSMAYSRGAPGPRICFRIHRRRGLRVGRNLPPDLGVSAVNRKRREGLRAQADDVQDRLNEFGSGRPDGAKRRPRRPLGNSRAAILRRLRRDFPELHELVLRGEVSPFAAACSAGFRRRPGRKPKQRPVDRSDITPTQEMELWLGAPDAGSSFASEEERQAAWFRHRNRLMAMWACDGKRPVAWWQYESPAELYYPGPDYERSTLFEANLLSESEKAELLVYWRHEFDRANAPGFTHCAGPGKFLSGPQAREAHYRWADVPPTLIEEWSAELLQRRQKDLKEGPRSEIAQSPQSTSTPT